MAKLLKAQRMALSTNYAVAYAVKMVDVDVIAAYPITPQTHVVEKLAEFIANGELNAEMIHVESEHSALSAVIGAAAIGARTFTATSAQGLEFMHEITHIASGMRLPIVMSVATRALSAPISIWCDYSDVMNVRDASWIIYFTSRAQETFDTIIQAYKVAENEKVLLPVMVAYDGFITSHTYEPVDLPDEEEVRKFVPKKVTWYTLNPKKPVTMGPVGPPDWYYEFKYQQVVAFENSLPVIKQVNDEFAKWFGRKYDVIELYMMDDAEIALVSYGSVVGTIRETIDELRKEGIKVGLLNLRLFRPFPVEDIKKYLSKVPIVGILDRAISYGAPYGGPAYTDIASVFYHERERPMLVNFIIGIGQRTILPDDIKFIAKKLKEYLERKHVPHKPIFVGVRE